MASLGFPEGELDGVRIEDASSFVGVPDAFQRMWVPHRMAYIEDNAASPKRNETPDGCVFCAAPLMADEESLIVFRGERCYVVMNLFPYNTGHVLINPYRHVALYDEATTEETAEMALLTQQAMRVIRRVSNCEGFNIGMNQGKIAGAGVSEHLHQHVVPRWGADANFFPIIARTKALPVLLGDLRRDLAAAWAEEVEAAR